MHFSLVVPIGLGLAAPRFSCPHSSVIDAIFGASEHPLCAIVVCVCVCVCVWRVDAERRMGSWRTRRTTH